jgi:hypothetical protein
MMGPIGLKQLKRPTSIPSLVATETVYGLRTTLMHSEETVTGPT